MTRILSIALLAATLGSHAALAESAARNLLPMGGDMGYGSTDTREPLVTGSIGRREEPVAGASSGRDDVRSPSDLRHRRVGVPGRVGF